MAFQPRYSQSCYWPGAKTSRSAFGRGWYGIPHMIWTRAYHWGGYPSVFRRELAAQR